MEFSFYIVRLTLKKSSKIINLLYDRKTRKLSGFAFENEPLAMDVILELFKTFFPPTLESIGSYHANHHQRVDYHLFDFSDAQLYKSIQQTLKLL